MASTSSSLASSYPGQDSNNSNYSAFSPSSSTTKLSSASLNLIIPPPPRSSSSPSPYASLSFQYNPLKSSRITAPERIKERRSRYAELDSPLSTSPIAMSAGINSPEFRLTPEAIQARREAEISRALDWLSSHPDIRSIIITPILVIRTFGPQLDLVSSQTFVVPPPQALKTLSETRTCIVSQI